MREQGGPQGGHYVCELLMSWLGRTDASGRIIDAN